MNYLNQPREVSIETLALCNAECSFCPYPTLTRKGAKLTDTSLLYLISQMKSWRYPFTISPFKVNEPFLDNRLIPFCRWINEDLPLASLRLFTNATALTEQKMGDLQTLRNVKHLWVSLNEIEPERYYQTMKLDFALVTRKLDLLHEMAMTYYFPVMVSRVGLAANAGVKAEQDAACAFNAFVLRRWPMFNPINIKRDGWINYTAPQFDIVPRTPCARWEELSIMADGRVALCCMDGTGEHAVGDIHLQSMLEIYNQPKLLALRIGDVKRKEFAPCNRCTY